MIKNITKKKILVKNFETADSFGKRTKGLMFRNNLPLNSGLLMIFKKEGEHGIWMLGMRFPIDLVFIDCKKRIVDIKHSVKPLGKNPNTWKVYKPSKPCKYVLEVNSGLMQKTKTEVGDFLEFNDVAKFF
jgi:hypothetical protein